MTHGGARWEADPLGEIDRQIALLGADRSAWQRQLEEDVALLLRAEHVVERVRRQVDADRSHVREDTAELAVLRVERGAILPGPRRP